MTIILPFAGVRLPQCSTCPQKCTLVAKNPVLDIFCHQFLSFQSLQYSSDIVVVIMNHLLLCIPRSDDEDVINVATCVWHFLQSQSISL